jgi:hypothetical protein
MERMSPSDSAGKQVDISISLSPPCFVCACLHPQTCIGVCLLRVPPRPTTVTSHHKSTAQDASATTCTRERFVPSSGPLHHGGNKNALTLIICLAIPAGYRHRLPGWRVGFVGHMRQRGTATSHLFTGDACALSMHTSYH